MAGEDMHLAPSKLLVGKHKTKGYWVAVEPDRMMELIMCDDIEAPFVFYSEHYHKTKLQEAQLPEQSHTGHGS